MQKGISTLLVLILTVLAISKPIYDFKTSYVTQLTDFNFKDQVTKIRQNTNYVALVQFYKYNGNLDLIKMVNHWTSPMSSMNGSTNTMECLGLGL